MQVLTKGWFNALDRTCALIKNLYTHFWVVFQMIYMSKLSYLFTLWTGIPLMTSYNCCNIKGAMTLNLQLKFTQKVTKQNQLHKAMRLIPPDWAIFHAFDSHSKWTGFTEWTWRYLAGGDDFLAMNVGESPWIETNKTEWCQHEQVLENSE